jgi:uncharacterized membrane protein
MKYREQVIKRPMQQQKYRLFLCIAWIITILWFVLIFYFFNHWNNLNLFLKIIAVIVSIFLVPGGVELLFMNYSRYLKWWHKTHPQNHE